MASVKSRRKQVYSSVFSTSSISSTAPTPVIGTGAFSHSPGDSPPVESYHELLQKGSLADQRIAWNRAWHTATRLLGLCQESSKSQPQRWDEYSVPRAKQSTKAEIRALEHVLSAVNGKHECPATGGEPSLVDWFTNEVRVHFLTVTKPQVLSILANASSGDSNREYVSDEAGRVLYQVHLTLKRAQLLCLELLETYILAVLRRLDGSTRIGGMSEGKRSSSASKVRSTFVRDLHALAAFALPQNVLSDALQNYVVYECRVALNIPLEMADDDDEIAAESMIHIEDDEIMSDGPEVRSIPVSDPHHESLDRQAVSKMSTIADGSSRASGRLIRLFEGLEEVGLGGERGQRALAEAMDAVTTEYIDMSFTQRWRSPSRNPQILSDWIKTRFTRLASMILGHAHAKGVEVRLGSTRVKSGVEIEDVEEAPAWVEHALSRLGRLRVGQLFDIIVDWDSSRGAIEDLKTYTTTPLHRTHLATSFAQTLSQRLLQPGASTMMILQIYISLIRAFYLLDPTGVLLDRVARPIRRYLKERDDTVKVIVTGLLADSDGQSKPQSGDSLIELAYELNHVSSVTTSSDGIDLDWDDMSWTPDPIDAGPDYKRSKVSDIVSSLLSLFDSGDVFIREIQNIMGERLLKRSMDLDKEIRIIELLKLRFGEGALQVCEVMLRDVRESRTIDRVIRGNPALRQSLPSAPIPYLTVETSKPPVFHATILSRLFWPDLHDAAIISPLPISTLQAQYASSFEKLKGSRKLRWLPILGHTTVELQLEDRTATENCHTWQATVIYAFQSSRTDNDNDIDDDLISSETSPISLSVEQLVATLDMSESLVRNALTFWVSKRILHSVTPDVYTVLERLPTDLDPSGQSSLRTLTTPAAHTGDIEDNNQILGASGAERVDRDRFRVYEQFVRGMLTNGGPMVFPQIVAMLRMVVPGATSLTDMEIGDWLDGLVEDGILARESSKYRMA